MTSDVNTAVAEAHRQGWSTVLAGTMRLTRDLELAEECVQEAYAAALGTWAVTGVPDSPTGWIATTARRRAIDAIRRKEMYRAKLELLVRPPDAPVDEPLHLIFMCCHPALSVDVRPALTLRLVCGLSTREIADLFLVSEPAMAARLTRAKKKITAARIPFRVPESDQLPERLPAVLAVVHLLFTIGHAAPSGATLLRAELADRAVWLARMLHRLMPAEPEVRGLLALVLATDARRNSRVDARGRLVRLDRQDRSRWDRAMIAEADALIVAGLRAGGGRPGRYLLQAAIAGLYAEAPSFAETDWGQIVALYDVLRRVWPSPVVDLNRTVALSRAVGPEVALREIERLERDDRLAGYRYLPAIKADVFEQLGRPEEAARAYRSALDLAANEVERQFLGERLAEIDARQDR